MRRRVTTWGRNIAKQTFDLYVNEPPAIGRTPVSYEDYEVFISHKGDDTNLAETVGDHLSSRGVNAYLDRWDPAVDGDSDELEVHIRKVIEITDGILAVVTENTATSWWVPFEIGVARQTESQVATYLSVRPYSGVTVVLPSYLRTWPILVGPSELTEWADAFAGSRQQLFASRTSYFEKSFRPTAIDGLVASNKVVFR